MRVALLITVVLFVWPKGTCQNGFNTTFNLGAAQSMISVLYVEDTLNVFGLIFTSTEEKQGYFVSRVDTHGFVNSIIQINDSADIRHLSTALGVKMIKDDAGDLVIPVNFYFRPETGMLKIHPSGSLYELDEYSFGNERVVINNSLIQTDGGNYLMTGSVQKQNYDIDAFVLKTSQNGEKKWLKTFGTNGISERGFTLVEVNPNEYVIGGVKDGKGYIFVIDSLGNKNWEWQHPDTTEVTVKSLRKESNGDWTYLSHTYRPTTYSIENPYLVYIPLFIRRDSAMNLLVRKELVPYAYMNEAFTMIPSRDGGWITAGTTSTVTDSGPADSVLTLYGRVVKLDEDGDIEWEVKDTAFFSQYFSRSYLSGVVESPTGSIYAVGYCEHPTDGVWRSYGWLLKITADGCVDTLCTTTSLLDQLHRKSTLVDVYPNPTTDYLIFDLDERLDQVRVEIFDLNGRILQSQHMRPGISAMMLDMARVTSGIYVWRVMTTEGRIVDMAKFVMK